MGIHLLWMVTCYFRVGEPLSIQRGDVQIPIQGISSRHQVLHYPEDRPLRSKTYAANDTVEFCCPWCESLPLTATALGHGNPTGRVFNFSYHDFLVVWSKVIEATRLGDFIQPLVPYMARHSGPSNVAVLGTRRRKEIKDRGRWKSDPMRAASTAPHIIPAVEPAAPPSVSCPEVRKRVAQGDFRLHGHQQCSNASRSVNQFLSRRPTWRLLRGYCPVLRAKLDEEFGSVVSLLIGITSIWQPTDLRRLRSDVRTGRVLGAILCPSCASWSHCRDSHADQRCSDVWGQKPCSVSHFRLATETSSACSDPGAAQMRDSMDFLSHPPSSYVWCIFSLCSLEQHHRCHSVIFDLCAFGTPWKLRTKLIAGHCDYQDILPLAEYSCNKHHVCAFSRRPHIQLFGEDLSERQFTARCKVLPPRLCSKLCNIIIFREIGNR